jgi:hypothetical protein
MALGLVKMCRIMFFCFGLIFIALGMGQIQKSTTLPAFSNQQAMERLRIEHPPELRNEARIFWKNWFERARALDGGKYAAFDNGLIYSCMGVLCLISGLFFHHLFLEQPRAILERRWAVMVSFIASYSIFHYDNAQYHRGLFNINFEYGPSGFADGMSALVTVLLITMVLHGCISSNRYRRSVIWPLANTDPMRAAIVSLIFVPILAFGLYAVFTETIGPAGWLDIIWVSYILILLWWLYQVLMTPPIKSKS